jgi:hypothetical protein
LTNTYKVQDFSPFEIDLQPISLEDHSPGRKNRDGAFSGGGGIRGENQRGGPPSSVRKKGT